MQLIIVRGKPKKDTYLSSERSFLVFQVTKKRSFLGKNNMIFNKLCVIALLALATSHAHDFDPNPSTRGQDGLLQSIEKQLETSSGNLRRNLLNSHQQHKNSNNGGVFDACHFVSQHFGKGFLNKNNNENDGGCKCDGTLDDVLTLHCNYKDVCDKTMCASVDVKVTLTHFLDENGRLGKDPKMNLASCVDTDMEFLDTMCLDMDFSKPDFFLPTACSFSYGNEKCICDIDDSGVLPCYKFDCSQVVVAAADGTGSTTPTDTAMARMLVSDSCKAVDLSRKNDVSIFLPALSSESTSAGGNHEGSLSPIEKKFASWAERKGGAN